jgi:hypothetical protein
MRRSSCRRHALSGLVIALAFHPDARDQPTRDIVAIAQSLLDRVGRRHSYAAGVEEHASQQISLFGRFARGPPLHAVGFELLLNSQPEILIDDRRMLARIGRTLVDDLAAIDPVLQHLVERAAREGMAAIGTPVRSRPSLADDALCIERGLQFANRAELEVSAKDHPDRFGFRLVDDEFSVLDVIAERGPAAHPQPFLLRGGDLVADAFARDLALELGKGQQHVERQPPHGGGR